MLALRQHTQRPVRIVVFLVLVYAFCWIKGWPRYYDDEELPAIKKPSSRNLGPHAVGHEHLIVSVTTTAVNAYTKVPPLLVYTPEQDHGQLLLFSDLQMEIGKWPIFDVIWRFPQDFIRSAPELGRYRAQVDYGMKSLPLERLKKKDEKDEKEILATLDKYKILQTMAAAWEYRPDRAWYVFMGDETYINRGNLLDWLSQYDPDTKHFFGNPPTPHFPDPFAASGDSIIVSKQVMKELFKDRKDLTKNWQKRIIDYPNAFDLVFNVLQTELKVGLEGVWPGISGFNPSTIPFSPALWCEPILMMHHVTTEAASDVWRLEKERGGGDQDPMRVKDLWDVFMRPENLNFTRHDWDNLSSEPSNARWNILFEGDHPDGGRAKNGEESEEACEQSCNKSQYCMQWSYSSVAQKNWNENPPTQCHLSSSVRFGRHVDRQEVNDNGETAELLWRSGWKKGRFMTWATQQRCKAQHQR